MLDIHTILFADLLIVGSLSVAFALLWRNYRSRFAGLGLFFAIPVLHTIAMALFLLRGQIPDLFSIVCANLLVMAGYLALPAGFRRLFGRPVVPVHTVLPLLIGAACLVLFTYAHPSLRLRIVCLESINTYIFFRAWIFLARQLNNDDRSSAQPAAVILFLFMAVAPARVLFSLIEPANHNFITMQSLGGMVIVVNMALGVLLLFTIVMTINALLSRQIAKTIGSLRESEERYRSVVDNAPAAILIVDNAYRITFCNQQFFTMTGHNIDAVYHHDFLQIIAPRFRELLDLRYRQRQRGERVPSRYEAAVLCRDGTERDCEIFAAVYRDPAGVPRTLIQAMDITERKKNETELNAYRQDLERLVRERTDQLLVAEKHATLGVLAAGIAHEIHNPNNYIMLNIDLLKKGFDALVPELPEPDRLARKSIGSIPLSAFVSEAPAIMDDIRGGASRIERIVTDLKNYAHPDSHDQWEPVDLNEVVATALKITGGALKKHTRRINRRLHPKPVRVQGSCRKLEQAVTNLIHNAALALTDRCQGITVTTGRDSEGFGFIEVADEGRGIPRQDLSRVTDPFFTTRRKNGGTGLGLWVVEQIVQEHHGDLRVRSTAGKWTTVRIRLQTMEDAPCQTT
ncbi:MAG: PAS domain S-box protein [Chitinivibrionales bacterium]|nr:PAS domain S-box protein [Chitinivibrionales bacterium]